MFSSDSSSSTGDLCVRCCDLGTVLLMTCVCLGVFCVQCLDCAPPWSVSVSSAGDFDCDVRGTRLPVVWFRRQSLPNRRGVFDIPAVFRLKSLVVRSGVSSVDRNE